MSNVKSMMAEEKRLLRLIRFLLRFHCRKLLRGAMRVLLACSRLVVLALALPLYATQIYRKGIDDLSTKEEKA